MIESTSIAFLCVPTPMKKSGECDLSIVRNALTEISNIAKSLSIEDFIVVIKSTVPPGTTDKLNSEYKYLAFFIVVIVLISLFKVFKQKNKPLVFFGLYTGAQLLLSFVILQARWDQPRIVLICMPVMLILMYLLIYNSVKKSEKISG